MAKLTTTDLTNLQNEASAVAAINANFAAVETAMEKTLSRDGTSPNTMSADLDMNSQRILNLPEAVDDTEPVRLGDVEALIASIGTGPQGPTGATGPAGSNGTNGTDGVTPAIQQTYSSTTTASDPGNGAFRLNNATLSSVTAGYFDNVDSQGNSITGWLDSFDDNNDTTNRGTLQLIDVSTPSVYALYKVTGSVVDSTGYRTLTLSHLSSNGTFSGLVAVSFFPAGSKGADGAGAGDVTAAAAFTTDNLVIRSDGTGKGVQNSGITLDDTNNMTGVASLGATTIELGHASDTTLARVSAGVVSVEGETVHTNSTSRTVTAAGIELGHASDTTLSRSSAGVLAVEGVTVALNSTSAVHTAGTIELGATSDTTLSRVSAGVVAVEGATIGTLSTAQTWTKPQKLGTTALTSASAWDGTANNHLTVNVNGGAFTIANPSAATTDVYYSVYVTYTTTHSISWGNTYKGISSITPTATAGAYDHFVFRYNGTNMQLVGYNLNIGA